MVIRSQSFTTHCIFITLKDLFITKIQFLKKTHFYIKCSKFSGGRVLRAAAAAHVLHFNSTKCHWLELQMSNILSSAYFLLSHTCMWRQGICRSALDNTTQKHISFRLVWALHMGSRERQEGLISAQLYLNHSELVVLLNSANMLLSL